MRAETKSTIQPRVHKTEWTGRINITPTKKTSFYTRLGQKMYREDLRIFQLSFRTMALAKDNNIARQAET